MTYLIKAFAYCAASKYKIGKRGYTAWTLVPLWGIAGLGLEWAHKALDIAVPAILLNI